MYRPLGTRINRFGALKRLMRVPSAMGSAQIALRA
jgi:hypothetical protein